MDDLTALFGNLLKNAVEAAAGVSEAYIDVTANYNYKSKQTFISVENSVLHPRCSIETGGLFRRRRMEGCTG